MERGHRRQGRMAMGQIVVSEFVTADGVAEGPGTDQAFSRDQWAFRFDRGSDGDQFKLDELKAAGALLLGRLTYEGFAAAWPTITDEAGFAEKMNSIPKYVVSGTLREPTWQNTTVITGDVPAEIQKLRDQVEGDVLINGSTQLVHSLIEHDLIDEYRLMVFPIIVGAGKRLFGDTRAAATLRLVETRTVGPDGVTIVVYRPAR